MKLPGILQIRVLKEALTALFTGPYTHPFPYQPSEPQKRYRGMPKFDEEGCVGCGACAETCPADDIQVVDDLENKKRTISLRYDECIYCGTCEATCITEKGVKLSKDYATVYLDRKDAVTSIEKDLVLCEKCGAIVGTPDHIKWVADRLGPLAYSNPTLLLSTMGDLKMLGEVPERQEDMKAGRYDVVRILCPTCRREIQLKA